MPFELTEYDRNLVESIEITIDAEPISEFNFRSGVIPVQFPPFISSDSKATNWTYNNKITYAWEPLVTAFNSGPRKVSLKLQYIATGNTHNKVTWDTTNISNIVKDIRGYFYSGNLKSGTKAQLPIVKIKLLGHLPDSGGPMTFRAINMSEKPGDTYITIGDTTYTFMTEVTLVLEAITNIQKKADGKPYTPYFNLKNRPPSKWY